MVVKGTTGRDILQFIKVPNNVNVQYYIDNVLKTYLEREIPKIYLNEEEKVILQHDKTTSHVAKLTIKYLENLRSKGDPNYI